MIFKNALQKNLLNEPKTLTKSFRHAFRGLGYTIVSQSHMQFHIIAMFVALVLGAALHLSTQEWLWLFVSVFLVLISEMFNTSMELSVDLTTRKKKMRAMLSKDVAAGAVLLASIHACFVGSIIFLPKLYLFFQAIFNKVG